MSTNKDERRAKALELARSFQANAESYRVRDLMDQRAAWDTAERCVVRPADLDEVVDDTALIAVTPEIRAAAISDLDARIAALRDGGRHD